MSGSGPQEAAERDHTGRDAQDVEPTADALIAAMRTASGPRLTELGSQLAERLEREQALRDNEIDELRRAAQRLDRAVADLTDASSGTVLLRRACAALADICSAERVLASSIEADRAVPVATYESGDAAAIPADYPLLPGSAESRVVTGGGAPLTGRPVAALRHLFPQDCTIMVVTVGDTPALIVHVAQIFDAAQHDSATLVLEVLGGCLRRLGLAARRARQLELLRSSGVAREGHTDVPAAETAQEPTPPAPPWMEPLTERESEVLRLILTGSSNTAIATELVITVDTVKSHVKRILRKLGATNRSELIARHSAGALTNRSIAPPSR
ncbi:LuxR C-terminal-related transcriptional regulator [Nocardia nova]|uniref:helix-turn-helix transcriptional regulator n=1 Tax=Nocardia nova TaxID=37330 RepID=UPI000CEA6867|nr:LuxR C-terminal-related transcriptional regulator [Nocardia nova]PPJ12098.1 LuxR family transcriptional regulator [Nocardia nova]PPJ14826.1 LuxR family transcriptional regulator [Nocardia nova]